jgi:hypothetical protein
VSLDRDRLSDLVQGRGLPTAVRLVAHCRAAAQEALDELYRQIVINGRSPDAMTLRKLIDELRSIGATTAVFQVCRLMTGLRLSEMRNSLFGIIATALISCEQAMGYLQSLETGLEELETVDIRGDGEADGGWDDDAKNRSIYVIH